MRTCIKCGDSNWTTRGDDCKTCQKARSRAWYEKNKELCLKRASEWYENNKSEIKIKQKKYAQKNPDIVNACTARWSAKNKDKVYAKNKIWKQANKDLVNAHTQNYRSRKKFKGGVLSRGIRKSLMHLQNGLCIVCKVDLTETSIHLDHIVPLSKGGLNIDSNIQLLCSSCNCKKGSKDPVEFMQSLGYLL